MQSDGKDVIRLDEGAPDLPPAPHIIDALHHSAMSTDLHSYQPHKGTKALREAWAVMYEREHNVKIHPETEVLPLLGSKEGIFHLPLAFVDPGEVVLIPDPSYITYTKGTLLAGGIPYYLKLEHQNGYLPEIENIPADIVRRSRVMWLNYPNNPTASMATLAFFEKIIDFGRRNQILICHDAAYTQVTYNGKPAPSILQVDGAKDVAIEFNTLSKSHNMAGWRVGAVVGNAEILRPLYTLKTNLDSGAFRPILDASVAAMTGDQNWLIDRNAIYKQRRDLVLAGLSESGLKAQTPEGSLYVWVPIFEGWSAQGFCSYFLEEGHLSLTPGTVFGTNGEGFVRISLTAPNQRIEEAMDRMKRAVQRMPEKESGWH